MEILKGIKIVDLGLLVDKTLIVGDFHIGYEEALNKQGILVPRFQFEDIVKRITPILERTQPETIIINGDLKHEFGTISETEWKQTLKFLDLLSKHCKKIILIKGNHDKILEPIAKKRNLEIVDHYVLNNIYICHGNSIPDNIEQKIIIIGHEHPAVVIRTKLRAEKYKCFLLGTFNRKKLIVIPSFNLVTEGTDVLKEHLLSPFLKKDIGNFNVFVIGKDIYDFGKIKKLKHGL